MLKAILSPYLGWIYGAAALAAVTGTYLVYDAIYDRGYRAAAAVYEQKILDQKAANDWAIEMADVLLRSQVSKLTIEKERLKDEVLRLNAEASQDPDGASGGLKRSSVRRLNAIR